MDKVSFILMLFILAATSAPAVNASPLRFAQMAQTTASLSADAVTDAISVSRSLNIAHSYSYTSQLCIYM